MACELVEASRFFLLPNLEKIIRKFMHVETVQVVKDLPKVASLLTEAVGFTTLSEATDVSTQELVTVLVSNWSDTTFARHLSADAFQYLLANSKSDNVCELSPNNKPVLFSEYFRFRQVMRWWVSQAESDPVETEKLLSIIVPEDALSICDAPETYKIPFGDSRCIDPWYLDRWESLQVPDKDLQKSLLDVLAYLDFKSIPPVLLEKVVEPLKLVSSEAMLEAFRL